MSKNADQDILLMGLSIGYKKRVGDDVDESLIEREFLLTDPKVQNQILEMVSHISYIYLEFAIDAVDLVKKELRIIPSNNLYIALADHISSAVTRYRQGIIIENALLIETKKFYRDEFSVAEKIVARANQKFDVDLKEDESAFITLHIVNSMMDQHSTSVQKMPRLINEILNIIKSRFSIEYDENNLTYMRLITHLKYFSIRILSKTEEKTYDQDLLDVVKERYHDEYDCAKEILAWTKDKYAYEGNDMDVLYLTIHIARIVKEKGGNADK